MLDIDVVACKNWVKDSPYTSGVPKSMDNTIVHIGGSRVPYSVRKRSCHPPNVWSLMPESVADLAHEEGVGDWAGIRYQYFEDSGQVDLTGSRNSPDPRW